MLAIAPLSPRFPDIQRIAVLRGGGLGDLMFALPALQALRDAYPDASITLLGMPAAAALLQGRPGPVDEVVELPVAPGVREPRPGERSDPDAVDAFTARMRHRRFDLAVQVHGGGRNSNPFLLALDAAHTVGTRTPDAAELERSLPYVYYQHEVLRALEVVGLAGAVPTLLEPELAVTKEERRGARARLAREDGDPRPLVVLHPGATDPRRRWPAERFAELARRLAEDGARVVVVGDASDAPLADRIMELAGEDVVTSLAGALTLGELLGVLAIADAVVANDSGPRHLALAVGAPTVGIFWIGNVINAGPQGRGRHRIHFSWTTNCPVCGRDATQVGWTAPRCEHDVSFVADVPVERVYEDARDLAADMARARVTASSAPLPAS